MVADALGQFWQRRWGFDEHAWLPKPLASFVGFGWRLGRGATWASFESGPTWPFCDFRPFGSCVVNSVNEFLPLLYIAGVV
jgi:hypothetical protein